MRSFRWGAGIAVMAILLALTWYPAQGQETKDNSGFEPSSVAAADTESSWEKIPAEMMLSGKAFVKDYYGPVPFSHKKHNLEYNVRCAVCHHFQETDPKPEWKCVKCHNPEKKVGKIVDLMDAYHTDCRGCHEALVEDGKSEIAPYKKCVDCHQEEKKEKKKE